MSEVLPDFDDGVPVDDEAEPADAGIEHVVDPEDLLSLDEESDEDGGQS